ncbi:MAG TPA: alpha-1,4-glucan--maltose-1-phosphate maltosyltransferase [Thermoanaerobaculia bacterium]|nr:alpha-1,4-glucan--maltose-1-phosphate maltosyltransferase [Thermoanaerobaculia bacterium]
MGAGNDRARPTPAESAKPATGGSTAPEEGRRRVVIEGVEPEIDCGRYPAKRTVGEKVVVEADAFTDGHDEISCRVLWRDERGLAGKADWSEEPMTRLVNDRWRGEFTVTRLGRYSFTVEAWVDHFKSWRRDLRKRVEAGQDVKVDLQIGAALIREAAERAERADAKVLRGLAGDLDNGRGLAEKLHLALDDELGELMERYPDRRFATRYPRELPVRVDRELARFSAWYELFPRSASPEPGRHGTFADVEARLPYVAEMGFDILYLPPIHPIGRTHRKGKNNAVAAQAGDVGSPWAIGGEEGGHKAIHPELGTPEEFRRLVERARDEFGLEVALDIAFQVSPDHPYVAEHEEWFRKRPDGTVQYAENPPKKYQDIYPFDFESEQWQGLWQELLSVFEHWIGEGVRVFRVDNPHTKPFPFWEWVIGELKRAHPEVIFLSEAFTRPKVMYRLAKLGFTQSYTYFAWRTTKWELTEYFTELTTTEVREFFRPSLWPNTPDILTEQLQFGGPPMFAQRLVLAATLGASYGIYGPAFEQYEARPREPGSEEYMDSEKYQLRHWDVDRPGTLAELIGRVNRIRKQNPALHSDRNLEFHPVDNDQLIAYSKRTEDGGNVVLVVVNLDPHHVQSGWLDVPLDRLGLPGDKPYQVHDLLTDARYLWNGPRNFIQLDPASIPAHVFLVRRKVKSEQDFDYYM